MLHRGPEFTGQQSQFAGSNGFNQPSGDEGLVIEITIQPALIG